MKTLAIIGGGAAGLAAAIAAADELHTCGLQDSYSIDLYEAEDRVGRSILATGNGRCNFSNARIDAHCYRNASFVNKAFTSFQAEGGDVLRFFEELGLCWREESEGRLYPFANKASVVLEILRARLDSSPVKIYCDSRVESIEIPQQGRSRRFSLYFRDGLVQHADAVIFAVGGLAAQAISVETFDRFEMQPVLGPLATKTHFPKQLDNIRVKGCFSLIRKNQQLAQEQGELLFRKYGVSGIAVFNLSRLAEPGDCISIDFVPWLSPDEIGSYLHKRVRTLQQQLDRSITCADVLRGMVLPQVAEVICEYVEISYQSDSTKRNLSKLAQGLKDFSLEVTGIGDARQCQVARGGFNVRSFHAHSFEAKEVPHFYVVGESLDVDAPCGGFNLHWAWVSGLMAGKHAIQSLYV